MRKRDYILGVIIMLLIVLMLGIVGKMENVSTVNGKVISVSGDTVAVEMPNGHIYEFYQNTFKEGETVKVTVDGRGTFNKEDDEILKVTHSK